MDGTFRCVVEGFSQLYCLHGWYQGYCIPCLFCFIGSKSTTDYSKLFDEIENIALRRNLTIFKRHVFIMTDFEQSVLKSLSVFENIKFIQCHFHYSKNLFSYVRYKLGLKKLLSLGKLIYITKKQEHYERKEYKLYVGILRLSYFPYLPETLQQEGVIDAIIADILDNETDNEFQDTEYASKFVTLKTYLRNTYFSDNSKYHICVFGSYIRTNNNTEGFHSVLNRKLGPNPSIWQILERIRSRILWSQDIIINSKVNKLTNLNEAKKKLLIKVSTKLVKNQLDPITFLDDIALIIRMKMADCDRVKLLIGSQMVKKRVKNMKTFLKLFDYIEQSNDELKEFVKSKDFYSDYSDLQSKVKIEIDDLKLKKVNDIAEIKIPNILVKEPEKIIKIIEDPQSPENKLEEKLREINEKKIEGKKSPVTGKAKYVGTEGKIVRLEPRNARIEREGEMPNIDDLMERFEESTTNGGEIEKLREQIRKLREKKDKNDETIRRIDRLEQKVDNLEKQNREIVDILLSFLTVIEGLKRPPE